MNLETQILMASAGITFLSLVFSLVSFRRHRKSRELMEFVGKQIEDLENMLSRNKEALEANAQRMNEQARRVTWLETRIRQPKLAADEILADDLIHESPKLNITERRHRVIKLASRGHDVETIATALGMLPGEVDLILSLNKAAAATK
ncbi:hypothetical protein BH10ACI2_BH10ACI2_03530 [soil metagenome]